jgi:hypothetical protein
MASDDHQTDVRNGSKAEVVLSNCILFRQSYFTESVG